MKRLRILVVHNRYQQPGGEDAVVEAETQLLRQHGHAVKLMARHNHEISANCRLRLARDTLWSVRSVQDYRLASADFSPDIIHVHNTLPLISPSIYWAAVADHKPVVQTLHNFRLLCPQGMLLRGGRVCEDCVGHAPWRAVWHGCYRQSPAQSAVLATMLATHRGLGTWHHKVSRYIALNEFCKAKFIAGGLPASRIVVKPNFVDRPSSPIAERQGGLYVGRLAGEKGMAVLHDALDLLSGQTAYPIRVAGDGPEQSLIAAHRGAQMLGALSQSEVIREMQRASFLVLPSLWYENFPRVLVEAFACGLPVIASRLGALAELIDDRRTGLLFEPGNAIDLAEKIRWAEVNPHPLAAMGIAARDEYEKKYTAELNYQLLIAIYHEALADANPDQNPT